MVDLETIKQEIKSVLEAFGYKPTFKSNENFEEIQFYSPGSDSFLQRHKDAISMLSKGYLMEFYYMGDTHHVRLYKECKGLDPDNDRYSTLIYVMNKVPKNEIRCLEPGNEVFVNMYDHFKRLVRKN